MPPARPVGSKQIEHGYVRVKTAAGQRRWPYEHHVVWEAANGPIPRGCELHHVNRDRTDNRLENLELCTSKSTHMQRHADNLDAVRHSWQGHRHSDETKAQMSASAKALWQSEERRAHISAKTRERRALPQETQTRILSLRESGLSFEKIAEIVFGKRSAGPRVRNFLIGGRSRY